MAKKVLKKNNAEAKEVKDELKGNNPEVKVSVTKEKRNRDGSKDVTQVKGQDMPNEDNPISTLKAGTALVGCSKGYTINLGGYESARIQCWITKTSKDDETSIMQTFSDISEMLDNQLEFETSELNENRE